jgi:membrane protein involved in D-alanine export
VIPYADFIYFGLLLYAVVPTLILGLFGRTGWRWALFVTAAMLVIQYFGFIHIRPHFSVREIWILIGFAIWQWATVRLFVSAGAPGGRLFYVAIGLGLLPLAAAKLFPVVWPGSEFGFLGISYVTFRALDVVFCLRDEVIAAPSGLDLLMFIFFFPTISSGPIDRYRRFAPEWRRRRSRAEFLADLDAAVHRLFRGFLYKFIIAALIEQYWLERAAASAGLPALLSYMYAYSLYLFFDFAGYSAFAIALSYLFGVHTPENFDKPFLARNIRDFWNRWHITLSFWFRDHVYMRFLLAASRGRWFANKHTAAVLGYFLAFGLMGLWHGIEPHYIIYGLYQAALLSAFHVYSSRKKEPRLTQQSPLRRALAVFVTFNFVCFGFLIFSGRIGAAPRPQYVSEIESVDCADIFGWVADKLHPQAQVNVELWDGDECVMTFPATVFRQELAEAGLGSGRHAFYVHTLPSLQDGRRHIVHLRIAGTRIELKNSPQTIVCH